jgi:hypothetical protein
MQAKTALIHPLLADSLTYGLGGAGLGAMLGALTAAGPKVLDTDYAPRSVDKVIPKKVIPQPVFVDEAMAQRLAKRGIIVRKMQAPRDAAAGNETSGIDTMQKVAIWPFEENAVPNAIVGGATKMLPAVVGLSALGGAYYGVNKMMANRAKDAAKRKYVEKRRQLNELIASLDNASNDPAGLGKVAFELSDVLPWLIGVPFIAGGAMAFGDGYDSAVKRNPNIKAQADLDKYYADLPDTPKIQLTPVLKAKPKKAAPPSLPPADLAKTAGFNLGGLRKAFVEPGKANDILAAGGAAAAVPAAWGLSSNIDDPTYKWSERALMPLGVGAMLSRRVMGKTPVSTALKGGALGELGLFGGLRYLDAASNRNPKAQESMADAVKKLAIGGGVVGGLALGGQWLANRHSSREATRGRRAQSRQLKKILETVNTRHGVRNPQDLDDDGDVDDDDRALAAAAGVTAKPAKA